MHKMLKHHAQNIETSCGNISLIVIVDPPTYEHNIIDLSTKGTFQGPKQLVSV